MPMRVKQCVNLSDLRDAAKRRAHRMVFDYIDGGADDELALRLNSSAFGDYQIRHKVLTGVDEIDTTTSLLGTPVSVPFFASPSAGNRLFHTEGERAVARAVGALGTIYSLSTLSTVSIEEIAATSSGPKWFQLYVWKDRGLVREMLSRAREAGYRAMILTVDFAVTGNRERDKRNGFTIPPQITAKQVWHALNAPRWSMDYLFGETIRYANLSAETPATSLAAFVEEQLNAGFNWRDAEWLLGEWNGPAVIKGVVRDDDAKKAVSMGFNAVSISNHGGRQLDRSPAPIQVVEEIVDAVGADAEVIVDGGVRRGSDMLIALSLGAKAVSFARPYLYGLAAGGEAGVARALAILNDGLRRDMALAGIRSIAEIDRGLVRARQTPRR